MSKNLNAWERTLDMVGLPTMRCDSCHHRWLQSLWRLTEIHLARCPRCYRLQLSVWEETYYKISIGWRVLIGLGAKKVRCKPCRHNFLSFRAVRGNNKWINAEPAPPPGFAPQPAVLNSFSDLDQK